MKILFHMANDHYFLSHRLPLAEEALRRGHEVWLVATDTGVMDVVRSHGVKTRALKHYDRVGMNPLRETRALAELAAAYRSIAPDLVQHVAMKPALYGSIAATLARVPARVNMFGGLGYMFINETPKARVLRTGVVAAFRALLNNERTLIIMQNEDDRDTLIEAGAIQLARTRIVRGAGVDLERFTLAPEPDGPVTALFGGRMLWDKGVGEIVEASRLLRDRGVELRIRLAGAPDPANPRSIDESQLRAWHDEGLVEWLGHQSDMPALFRDAHIALLPSYREGLPKFLLEAAAAGRPSVTYDVPGCRHVVVDGETGRLVPAQDAVKLADALEELARDSELRRSWGVAARQRAEDVFATASIVEQTMRVYGELASEI